MTIDDPSNPADEQPIRVGVAMAPRIADDSWLHRPGDPEAEAFRHGYAYATCQTHAISALAKLTPEEAYHVWSAVQRGVERFEQNPTR